MSPQDKYIGLMSTIRGRFEYISKIKTSGTDKFFIAEAAAFHGRKIIEGIAFGCLVSLENGIKQIPNDAKGKWKADEVLKSLERKNLNAFPSPSIIRESTAEEREEFEVKGTIEGQPDRRLSIKDICSIYVTFHRWAHELNPYTHEDRSKFLQQYESNLWDDLAKLERFIEKHTISIKGEMFFCVLKDNQDGLVKILSLSKAASLL